MKRMRDCFISLRAFYVRSYNDWSWRLILASSSPDRNIAQLGPLALSGVHVWGAVRGVLGCLLPGPPSFPTQTEMTVRPARETSVCIVFFEGGREGTQSMRWLVIYSLSRQMDSAWPRRARTSFRSNQVGLPWMFSNARECRRTEAVGLECSYVCTYIGSCR